MINLLNSRFKLVLGLALLHVELQYQSPEKLCGFHVHCKRS